MQDFKTRLTILRNGLTFLFLLIVTSKSMAIPVPDDDGNSAAWIISFSVSSNFAKVGKPVLVQWQSAFSVGCSLSTNQTGSRGVPTSGNTTVTPSSPTTMSVTLSCTGTNGTSTSRSRSFSINRVDHPELLSLNVDRTSGLIGEQVSLSWSSSFSDYCELSGTNQETLPPSGSQMFFINNGTNTFAMECKSNDGRVSNPLSKRVKGELFPAPVILRFFLEEAFNGYYINWNADAEFCILDTGLVSAQGREFRINIGPTTHILTCHKNGVSVSRALTSFN